ncbi:hypothetical protein ACHAW6_007675 [Cyclotella cf. meneghiniana]
MIQLMIIILFISHHSLRQIDFIMAYTQALLEADLYMKIPHGIKTTEGNTKDYVLKFLADTYGQKQAGRFKLESTGFTQSCINECVFYRDHIIFIVYVDDGIFFGTSDDQLSHFIKELTDIGLQMSPGQLHRTAPRQDHGKAIIYKAQYLIKTCHLGLHFKLDTSKADTDLSGEWSKEIAELDPSTAKSRGGWFILYANCPVIWCSKLQLQVVLSTMEAEYIALSQVLCDVIPIMALLEEMKEYHFQVTCDAPYIYCKAFENNAGALELARLPKL